MKDPFIKKLQLLYNSLLGLLMLVFLVISLIIYAHIDPSLSAFANLVETKDEVGLKTEPETKKDEIVDGVHVATGFVVDEGYQTVIATCTACHSAKLVTQNRANKEGWKKMIVWMQETQNLWELGESEEIIINYLAKNYAPKEAGRRANLVNIEWYELEN